MSLQVYIIFLITTAILGQQEEINDFSLKLFSAIYAFEEPLGLNNFGVSPIAIWKIFALISEAAAGETFKEIIETLKIPGDNESMRSLRNFSNNVFRRNTNEVTLKRHSVALVNRSLRVHKDFCDAINRYDTEIYTIDPDNIVKLAKSINYYICLATEGKIRDVINTDMLNDAKLLLIDSMYFNANWTVKFDEKNTRKEVFYDDRGREKGFVDMMHQNLLVSMAYSVELDANIIEITFGKDKSFSMIILLPQTTLKKVMNALSGASMSKILSLLRSKQKLDISLPRFRITSEINLVKYLKYLGILNVFDEFKSELPGISDYPIHVSNILQKVLLEVAEEGALGSVVTSVFFENRIGLESIDINKPFAFFVFDKISSVIIYAGVYKEPDSF